MLGEVLLEIECNLRGNDRVHEADLLGGDLCSKDVCSREACGRQAAAVGTGDVEATGSVSESRGRWDGACSWRGLWRRLESGDFLGSLLFATVAFSVWLGNGGCFQRSLRRRFEGGGSFGLLLFVTVVFLFWLWTGGCFSDVADLHAFVADLVEGG